MKHHYINPRSILAVLLFIVTALPALHAQYVYDYKRTAALYFDKGDYYSASQYYEKYLAVRQQKIGKGNYTPYEMASLSKADKKVVSDYEKVMYNLAESYRMYNDYGNAEKWYAQLAQFDSTLFPLVRYWYGVTLRANKKYSEAESQLTQFLNSYKTEDTYRESATKELLNVKFIQQQLNPKTYHPAVVDKMISAINKGGATYAPVWFDDKTFVFTSSRPDSNAMKSKKNEDPYFNNLYGSISTGDNMFDEAKKIDIGTSKNTQEGVAAYRPDKMRMYVTEWVKVNGKNMGAIYMSAKQGDSWGTPVKLDANINQEGYSSIQPFVTGDGKYLMFASDRPGGLGKYDIWYASLDDAGKPGAAINMGNVINTKEDEEAPFFHGPTSTLVFASNGRVGMGGFDLYQSKGNWLQQPGEPQNMGYPINSTKDDEYFFGKGMKFLLSDAYFSSDRNSVCCLELYTAKRKNKYITGKVVDCDTHEPLVGAKVSIVDTAANKIILEKTIDATGVYGLEIEEFEPLRVTAQMQMYGTKSIMLQYDKDMQADTLFNAEICLKKDTVKPYPINRPVILQGIYYDFDKASLRPESFPVLDTLASVMKMYPDMTIQLSAHTDSKGSEKYNLKLSDARAKSCVDYLIKVGIQPERLFSKGFGKCCPIAPNTTPDGKDNPGGRQLNRRTEFRVIHY